MDAVCQPLATRPPEWAGRGALGIDVELLRIVAAHKVNDVGRFDLDRTESHDCARRVVLKIALIDSDREVRFDRRRHGL
jgi:hypothetical protein